jgi:hypothetical protein
MEAEDLVLVIRPKWHGLSRDLYELVAQLSAALGRHVGQLQEQVAACRGKRATVRHSLRSQVDRSAARPDRKAGQHFQLHRRASPMA